MLLSDIYDQVTQSEWGQWLAREGLATAAILILLLLVTAWFVAIQQKRGRTQKMLMAANDAAFGRTVPRSRSGAWGFAVSIEPPPERFREFNISYQPVSILDPVDFVRMLFGGHKTTLQIAGVLADAPTAEVTWIRGMPPARILGKNPGRTPWIHSRLDYSGAEYATRGANVGAIKHVFNDMYARFTPSLQSVIVQRERRPQLRIVLVGRIDVTEISPILASVRSLGRAAML